MEHHAFLVAYPDVRQQGKSEGLTLKRVSLKAVCKHQNIELDNLLELTGMPNKVASQNAMPKCQTPR